MKIVVIEDSLTTRRALIERMQEEPFLTVAGQASGSAEAMVTIELCKPDVVLLDLTLRDGDCGVEVLRELRAKGFPGYIYVLSASDYVDSAFDCKAHGANGFYDKGEGVERLVADLGEIALGAHLNHLRPALSLH